MKIFIIILNWNQAKLTMECVDSVRKMKVPSNYNLNIVVVDNGSEHPVTLSEVERSLSGNTRDSSTSVGMTKVIQNNKNLGFAGGNNVGIKYALDNFADYVMILNNDTLVDPSLLANLLNGMQKDPKAAIVSPKIYFAKGFEFKKEKYKKADLGKVIWYAGGKMDWKNIYGSNIGVDEVDKGQYDKEKEIDFATGACFLISATVLKETGIFDEKYFMYLEDADLSLRMKKKKYKIIYEPKAELWHKVAQSSGIGSNLNDYFISRNRLLFGFKYASLRTKLALIRESFRLFIFGRHWQAVGIRDFYMRRFGKGSWV